MEVFGRRSPVRRKLARDSSRGLNNHVVETIVLRSSTRRRTSIHRPRIDLPPAQTMAGNLFMNPTLPEYIKPGAFVALRNGEKARIYATDGTAAYPIHGAILEHNGWTAKVWHSTYYLEEGHNDVYDIISAWIDKPDCSALWPLLPPWIKWVAQDSNGLWYGYPTKPAFNSCNWAAVNNTDWYYMHIPKSYAPIYSGDWKDSLVERPTT